MMTHNDRDRAFRDFFERMSEQFRVFENGYRELRFFDKKVPSWCSLSNHALTYHKYNMTKVAKNDSFIID